MNLLKFGVIACRQMCKVKLSVYLGKLRFGLNVPFRQSLAKDLEFWVGMGQFWGGCIGKYCHHSEELMGNTG